MSQPRPRIVPVEQARKALHVGGRVEGKLVHAGGTLRTRDRQQELELAQRKVADPLTPRHQLRNARRKLRIAERRAR